MWPLRSDSDSASKRIELLHNRRASQRYTGAAALLNDLPEAQWLLGDRGYDADWFRDALQVRGIQP
jgi:GH15 family glucan-1,4-alpha-glucosidase